MATRSRLPFAKEKELYPHAGTVNGSDQSLPGWPNLQLSNVYAIQQLLQQELWARDLEQKARHLWILTTPSSANIHSLHDQVVRNREIIVTEDPKLHLVWTSRRIYIKPLPAYLLSHHVWKTSIVPPGVNAGSKELHLCDAARGFLRSYCYLIRHESDFHIAQRPELRLIPEDITWGQWLNFQFEIASITDDEVSDRYYYGELRLSRLNLYAPILFRRSYYIHMPVLYGEYFNRFYGPVLVTFAVVSTMLSAMQLALTAVDVTTNPIRVGQIFYWFGIVMIIAVLATIVLPALWWLWMMLNEWMYTVAHQRERMRSRFKTA